MFLIEYLHVVFPRVSNITTCVGLGFVRSVRPSHPPVVLFLVIGRLALAGFISNYMSFGGHWKLEGKEGRGEAIFVLPSALGNNSDSFSS